MRKLLILAMLLLGGMFPAFAMDNSGHVLIELWRQYEEAQKADRPQKEAEVLAKIKAEALKKNLPVDFYDAATQYVYAVGRRDWKQGDKLREDLEAEVKRFDSPLITFLWMREWRRASTDELWAYVKEHLKGFQGCNPALHRGVDGYLNGALKPFIRSDREFVLWNLLLSRRYADATQDEIYQELKKELAGSYPGDGALEYYVLSRKSYTREQRPEQKKALQALQNQYIGKALALYPEAVLLLIQKDELDQNKASSQQYKALDTACQRFETRRKAFKGDEATLAKGCTAVEYLIEQLEGQDLGLTVQDGRIEVLFKNLYHANLTLREGKSTVKTWKVPNLNESFYVQDTVSVELPVLPDGSYTIEARSGKHSVQENYTQYTLSLAIRQDAHGRSVYVTDYKTGQPLPFTTLRLLKGDQEVAAGNLRLNGFTYLPDAFAKQTDKRSYYSLEAVNGDRKSPTVSWGRDEGEYRETAREQARLYLNQGAYNPGDTVRFKGIVFLGTSTQGFTAVKGKQVTLTLKDTEDNVVGQQVLKTNEWGSVSGSFVLPTGLRGGDFDLSLDNLVSQYFPVDEYVLPSFDVDFDELEELYLVGSEVPVRGTVQSYSGHNLTGARVSILVEKYNKVVLEQEQALGADNRFSFTYPAQEEGYYTATVKVTDVTGETLEFSTGSYVGNSLSVLTVVPGAADAELRLAEDNGMNWRRSHVVDSRSFRLQLTARDAYGRQVPLPVSYSIYKADGTLVLEGSMPSGEERKLELPGSGLYTLKTRVSALAPNGEQVAEESVQGLLCVQAGDTKLSEGVTRLFLPGKTTVAASAPIQLRLGSNEGPLWADVALFGSHKELLSSQQVKLEKGELGTVTLAYPDSYPDAVRLVVFYFQDGEAFRYERIYRHEADKFVLPLSFTRFQDKAYPGTQYTFNIKTDPKAEVLVAAWDKSLDAIEENYWQLVSFRDALPDGVHMSSACGRVGSSQYRNIRIGGVMASKAVESEAAPMMEDAFAAHGEALEETVVAYGSAAPNGALEEVRVRSDFASALTFQPHLYPKADGTLEFSFRTSDKLSTYYVRVYAHDKNLHNALCEQEMVVSLPVKVSLVEPRFLYEGDVYEAAVTVSSVASEPVSGILELRMGDTAQQLPVTVEPGGTVTKRFTVKIPDQVGDDGLVWNDGASSSPATTGDLTLKASFIAKEFSDAVQVTVPVYPAAQVLTEAHSAVLRDAMSREALLSQLRSRFVNVPASEATLKDISVLDMVKDAIPSHVEPRASDVLSLSEAWYIRLMASRLIGESSSPAQTGDLQEKILSCRNGDGGFGWFEGMSSNAIITAVVLERMALLRERGFEIPDMSASVKFLDNKQFGTSFPVWCGWLSDAQYMRVRALYPQVPFEVKPVSATDKKRLADFKKDAKAYLTPGKKDGRGLEGQILAKARRLLTLRSLLASSEGQALAKAWGIGLSSKLEKSMQADVTSLLEYAVEHRDGGYYYPNAVMPYRGLLESEAYAHALLCQLLDSSVIPGSSSSVIPGSDRESPAHTIADGIRLWLMLQKETQHWDTEPAFIDAITAILDGSEAVLNTRVLALSATYEAPFHKIQAAGNGFTVERQFFRGVVEERLFDNKTGPNDEVFKWEPLQPGESVKVGEKIRVEYKIWNAENRSFVKLTAGREASLRPVEQLSGYVGWGLLRPLRGGHTWTFTPSGYRHVRASATEFYFDSYPEEGTELSEEFFVTQAGRFVAPVTVIESLYAPHYRANSAFRPALQSK